MTCRVLSFIFACLVALPCWAGTTRFCLEGEFDLGARYQGLRPEGGEFYATKWCVVTDLKTERVRFSGSGQSNPDMYGSWEVAYFPPDLVRIINADEPPDIEFHGTDNADEARSVRRLDPHRLMSEFFSHPDRFSGLAVQHQDGRLTRVESTADLPLRGRVPVVWHWDWASPDTPRAELRVDGELMFRASGRWEIVDEPESSKLWAASSDDPVKVPPEEWPARVDMELISLTDGVHLVRGVRTGFQHLVVETDEGLVVGDAPAGWVELHQIPPSDLVPGLGISGLSELLTDFLAEEFAGQGLAAVALTHHHDDHGGGARAFAAAGARVYAPAAIEAFLESTLNRTEMPEDRLKRAMSSIDIIPVREPRTIGGPGRQVRLMPMGENPHVDAMLGVWAVDGGYFFVSDIHVPRSEENAPSEHRAQTECWFAQWAVETLPDAVRIVNSHSRVETPVSRLRAYLESETCGPP